MGERGRLLWGYDALTRRRESGWKGSENKKNRIQRNKTRKESAQKMK